MKMLYISVVGSYLCCLNVAYFTYLSKLYFLDPSRKNSMFKTKQGNILCEKIQFKC